jgi:hypothetical protein
MSYNDDFQFLWSHLSGVDGIAASLGMLGVYVEIPHQWFVEHGVRPEGRQSTSRMTWLLSTEELWRLWRESTPKVRWKDVY